MKLSCVSSLKSILTIFIIIFSFTFSVKGCKDIIACGDATSGDYNLLLKVRDPSRPGLQVLCIVPEGYRYTYHHPWTGKQIDYSVYYDFIGMASEGDVIPHIVKAGMALSSAGIGYGDADSGSNWVNPTRNAWDDFDWIRYACEKAGSTEEAVSLMTKDAVDDMHATGVSENLFIVGPENGYIIEADAYQYKIKEIKNGAAAMSNYPKDLWKTQLIKKLPIATSFDIEKELTVRKGTTVRLNSLYGIRILDITNEFITVKQIPYYKNIKFIDNKLSIIGSVDIGLNGRETVGEYSVNLLETNGNKAKITISTKYKAWEDKIMDYVNAKYGSITYIDMINWSRLHEDDLDGLRPMCEDRFEFEGVTVYKIPKENYETLSSGWVSINHACSSIYVPFHICDNDIYEPYKTSQAAQLSLDLLNYYGHEFLTPSFSRAFL